MYEKDLRNKDAGQLPSSLFKMSPLPQVFFTHVTNASLLPGFFITGTLAANGSKNFRPPRLMPPPPTFKTLLPALFKKCHQLLIVIACSLLQLFNNSWVYLQIK